MSAADINVAFLEVYKKADAFIRDAYGTKDGVTEYLRRAVISSTGHPNGHRTILNMMTKH